MTITRRAFAWGIAAIVTAMAVAAPFASAAYDYRYNSDSSSRDCVSRYGYYNTNCFDDYYSRYYRADSRYDDYYGSSDYNDRYYAYDAPRYDDYRYDDNRYDYGYNRDSFYSYVPHSYDNYDNYDYDRYDKGYNDFLYRCGDRTCGVDYKNYNNKDYYTYDYRRTTNTSPYRGYNRYDSYSSDYIQYDNDRYVRADYYNESYASRRADWLSRTGRYYDYWF